MVLLLKYRTYQHRLDQKLLTSNDCIRAGITAMFSIMKENVNRNSFMCFLDVGIKPLVTSGRGDTDNT